MNISFHFIQNFIKCARSLFANTTPFILSCNVHVHHFISTMDWRYEIILDILFSAAHLFQLITLNFLILFYLFTSISFNILSQLHFCGLAIGCRIVSSSGNLLSLVKRTHMYITGGPGPRRQHDRERGVDNGHYYTMEPAAERASVLGNTRTSITNNQSLSLLIHLCLLFRF